MRVATWVGSLVLISSLLSAAAGAEMYRWVDENGNVHATSNLSDVPPEYRAEAENEPPPADIQIMDSPPRGGTGVRRKARRDGADRPLFGCTPAAGESHYEKKKAWDAKRRRLEREVAEKERKLDDVTRNPDRYGVKREGKTYAGGNVKLVARQELERAKAELREFLRRCPDPGRPPSPMEVPRPRN